MNGCGSMRVKFSEYLDGRLTGLEMRRMAAHLENCRGCAAEWTALRQAQASLAALGSVPEPNDLLLRVRVAVSQERARRKKSPFENWNLAWQNTLGPFLLQAAAGFASAVLLIGTVGVLVGLVAQPQSAHAGDEPLGNATAPRLISSIDGTGDNDMASLPGPIVVEVYVNRSGKVYDFHIVSGPSDPATRAQVEKLLIESVFDPARFFGQPVRGLAVVSFSGISVRG
jgi:hypothetical protein